MTTGDAGLLALAHAKADSILSRTVWSPPTSNLASSALQTNSTGLRSRQRPLRLLCLGCERTGTLSLRAALLRLGYYDVYHMRSALLENPAQDCPRWIRAIDAKFGGRGTFGREEWDDLLGDCTAAVDQPCAAFAEELLEAYPEAKVLLTVRDSPEAWHRSMRETICALIALCSPLSVRHPGWNPLFCLQRFFAPRMPGPKDTQIFSDKLVDALDGDRIHEADGLGLYVAHNERVRALVREQGRDGKECFLEFNVKQGWAPLCEFLGVEVPREETSGLGMPFPRVNDAYEYQQTVAKLRWLIPLDYMINIGKVLAVPVLASLLWSRLKGNYYL